MERPIVRELRDRAAQRSKTEANGADPFEWRKTTPEWRAADELEKQDRLTERADKDLPSILRKLGSGGQSHVNKICQKAADEIERLIAGAA
jgi:hypothetical protein